MNLKTFILFVILLNLISFMCSMNCKQDDLECHEKAKYTMGILSLKLCFREN